MAQHDTDRKRTLGGAVTVSGYKFGSLVARLTPAFVAQNTSALLAPTIALSLRDKRSMFERHLSRVVPSVGGLQRRRMAQQAFDSYMRYYLESFRLPDLSPRYVDKMFSVEGFANIESALERGKGVILALPHLGGWEWAGRWMADRGHKLTVVVEALQPPELFDWFTNLRSELGMNVVPLGPSAAPSVLSALRANEIVCLLCDRDIQGGGVSVDFFGERTTLPAGPAMLGLRAGATVLPTAVYFTKRTDGHHAVVAEGLDMSRGDPLRSDVDRITQDLAKQLENLIRRAPEQWHLFQPNWPSDPGYPHTVSQE